MYQEALDEGRVLLFFFLLKDLHFFLKIVPMQDMQMQMGFLVILMFMMLITLGFVNSYILLTQLPMN